MEDDISLLATESDKYRVCDTYCVISIKKDNYAVNYFPFGFSSVDMLNQTKRIAKDSGFNILYEGSFMGTPEKITGIEEVLQKANVSGKIDFDKLRDFLL
jgi:hypothetical protein